MKKHLFTAIALLVCLTRMNGHPAAASTAIDTDNPFFDIFYTYFGESKQKAKSGLKDLMSLKSFRGMAYINYGHICELEKRPDDALRYYKRALDDGERTALPYLYALQRRLNTGGAALMTTDIKRASAGMWIAYESSILELEGGHADRALDLLDESVKKGFSSRYLLDTDAQWSAVRNSGRFRELYRLTVKNSVKTLSALHAEAEKKLHAGTFLGINNTLLLAKELEAKGRLVESLRVIETASSATLPFHEKSISLYWAARIHKKMNHPALAEKYLDMFLSHLVSDEVDKTGYKELLGKTCNDIIAGDPLLKQLSLPKHTGDQIRK